MRFLLTQKYPQKRAFITGGAGALGKAFALLLAKEGWNIGITDIQNAQLQKAKTEIEAAGGICSTYCFDVADKTAFKNAFKEFTDTHKGIDFLINNAGVGDGGLFGDYELEKWEWITGINQMAVIYGTHFATPIMKKQRSGHILTISSIAGVASMPNMSMYNVTKAAVLALSESIYAELKPFGINISVALPEFFKSGIMEYAKGNENAKIIGKNKIDKAPFTPDEVAKIILKACDKNEFYILHPFRAKLGFFVRNHFPNFFLHKKLKDFKNKKWVKEALKT